MPSTLRQFFEDMGVELADESLRSNYEPGYVGADSDGPVIRWGKKNQDLQISQLRWGFPKVSDKHKSYITNIRNLESRWWKDVNGDYVTKSEFRCLVPFDRFSEWNATERKNAWFNVKSEVSFFAGVWRPWSGERLKNVGEKRRRRVNEDWELYSFLTTEPNSVVSPIHPKAMPVILTEPQECKGWMNGVEATDLQRPLADDMLELIE